MLRKPQVVRLITAVVSVVLQEGAVEFIKNTNANNKVVIWSK
jgi:hypothetical protein